MPYTVNRADFGAVYFIKTRARIGVYMEPLDDATKRRLERNAGVIVAIVVEGSPAFNADILPGDVLISFGDSQVRSVEDYQQLLNSFKGDKVDFVLDRDGRSITKTIPVLTY
jgi:S1-C subfamily serine protease